MKKKILVLNYEFPPLGGGASPVSYEIAKGMSENGAFDVDVITMGYKKLPAYEPITEHFRIYRVKCWRNKKEICHPWEQFSYLVSGYFKCRQLLKNNYYDLCHAHFLIPTGILALILKKRFKLKYVITAHGSDVPGFNPDRFKFLHQFTKPILKMVGLNSEVIISPSDFLQKKIIQNVGEVLKNKIMVIPNGIGTDIFYPQNKNKYIVATGRLLDRKGFQHIIKAVYDKDFGYKLFICGDGPMLNRLKQLACGSKTEILFFGWLSNSSQKYKDILSQAAIYVSASSVENASVALLEAMSSGCAIISSDIESNKKIINNGGMFFPANNSSDLKDKLSLLAGNKDLLLKYQEMSRQQAVLLYDWRIIVPKYINQLNIILAR